MNKKEILKNAFYWDEKAQKTVLLSEYINFGKDASANTLQKDEDIAKLHTLLFNSNFKIEDFYYQQYQDAFDILSIAIEDIPEEDTEEIENTIDNFESELEPDCYTSDLTEWLNSSNERVYYLTEALEQFEPKDGFELLSMAQLLEKQEIFDQARQVFKDFLIN